MNTREYISSGIIEAYVLGLASPEERTQFEEVCRQYPEVAAARNEFEEGLEKQLMGAGIEPPAAIKENLMSAIRAERDETSRTPVVSMERSVRRGRSGFASWLAVAAILLLIASSYFLYDFYKKNEALAAQVHDMKGREDSAMAMMEKMKSDYSMVSDPNIAVVNMRGTDKAPSSSASVYWDSTSTNVYLVVKNMPVLPTEKQYQLWALIDGKPRDLGLFDVHDRDGKQLILRMNNTQKADAFAITIENRGNTGGPTLEQLQAMGKITL